MTVLKVEKAGGRIECENSWKAGEFMVRQRKDNNYVFLEFFCFMRLILEVGMKSGMLFSVFVDCSSVYWS